MLSLSLAWHIVWFARVTLSCALLIVLITQRAYKQFPLFTVHTAWTAVAGTALVAMNYVPFVSGAQYFAGVAVSNGVASALAFAIIYQMFAERANRYPVASSLGSFAFRFTTLIFLATAIALAWFEPAHGPSPWTSAYIIIQRTARMLQCGQLILLFLFGSYFRLSWRSRAFGIALGFGILSSSSLAINAIHSQIAYDVWNQREYIFAFATDFAYLATVLVWLFYFLAPEQTVQALDQTPRSPGGSLPEHDLETWNQELERLLK